MDPKIQRLAKLLSEGDLSAAPELGVLLIRAGLLPFEGEETYCVRDHRKDLMWGGSRGWGEAPTHYATFGRARAVTKKKLRNNGGSLEILQKTSLVLKTSKVSYFEILEES